MASILNRLVSTNRRKLFVPALGCRRVHTELSPYIKTESPFERNDILKKFVVACGFGENSIYNLRKATIFHYQSCTDKLDPATFFQFFGLSDTLYSFYLVVQLHCWLCQMRSMREGEEGRTLRNEILERLWQDFDSRLDKLEVFSSSKRKSILNDLLTQYQGAMLSYDEGYLTDDKTLAGAVWRTLYSKDPVHPEKVREVVKYIRVQADRVNSIGSREWCIDGKFDWAPYPPLVLNKVARSAK